VGGDRGQQGKRRVRRGGLCLACDRLRHQPLQVRVWPGRADAGARLPVFRIISTTSRIWFIARPLCLVRKETVLVRYPGSNPQLFRFRRLALHREPGWRLPLRANAMPGCRSAMSRGCPGLRRTRIRSNVFFATDHGFVVYAAADRTSKTYTRSNGCRVIRSLRSVPMPALLCRHCQCHRVLTSRPAYGSWSASNRPARNARRWSISMTPGTPAPDSRTTPGSPAAYYSETRTFTADTSTGPASAIPT